MRRNSRRKIKYNETDHTIIPVHNPRTKISLEQSPEKSPRENFGFRKYTLDENQGGAYYHSPYKDRYDHNKYNYEAQNFDHFKDLSKSFDERSDISRDYRSNNYQLKTPIKSPYMRKSSFSSRRKSELNKSIDRRYGRAGTVVELDKERRDEPEIPKPTPGRFISRGGFRATKSKYINDWKDLYNFEAFGQANQPDLEADDENSFKLNSEIERRSTMTESENIEEGQSNSKYIRKSGYGMTTHMRDYGERLTYTQPLTHAEKYEDAMSYKAKPSVNTAQYYNRKSSYTVKTPQETRHLRNRANNNEYSFEINSDLKEKNRRYSKTGHRITYLDRSSITPQEFDIFDRFGRNSGWNG